MKNFRALKEKISMNDTSEYIDFHNQVNREEYSDDQVLEKGKTILENDSLSAHEIKKTLLLLAHSEDMKALHILDKYLSIVPSSLKSFATLAYQECLTSLSADMLEEDQVMVSTGLGSKNNMMRYYFVISHKNKLNFDDSQKKIIEEEFKKVCANKESEIESIEFNKNYALIEALCSINVAIGDVIDSGINQCNKVNNFLRFHYYTTNIEKPSKNTITEYLKEIG